MKPENLTTSEIAGALTPKNWISLLSAIFTFTCLIAGGGFWVGQKLTATENLTQIASFKASSDQLKLKLELSQDKLERATKTVQTLNQKYKEMTRLLENEKNNINQLNVKLEKSDNCTFIQNQIVETRKEIEAVLHPFVFSPPSKEDELKQQNRLSALEKRLANYQQQIGTCYQ